jgi:nucleotide-binding universal stress UspA family protein
MSIPHDAQAPAEEDESLRILWAFERLEDEALLHSHVIAVDGSADADRAFSWACNILPRQDKLIVVNGVREAPLDPQVEYPENELRPFSTRDLQLTAAQQKCRDLLAHYQRKCKMHRRSCEFRWFYFRSTSDLARKICRVAEGSNATTVICGSRGVTPLDRVMLGSVSTAVLNKCKCSVLVARNLGYRPDVNQKGTTQ